MKQKILIKSIENVRSKAGKPYWKVETDDGMMTCFEASMVEDLEAGFNSGGYTFIDMVENDKGFKNIRGVYVDGIPKPGTQVMPGDDSTHYVKPIHKPQPATSQIVKVEKVVDKDKSIVAQCLVKAAARIHAVNQDKQLSVIAIMVTAAYKQILEDL